MKEFLVKNKTGILLAVIAGFISSGIIILTGALSKGFTAIYPFIQENGGILLITLVAIAMVSGSFIWIANLKLNKFSRDLKRLIEINPLGRYKEIGISGVAEYEKKSKEVLVITDSFKFENKDDMNNPVINEMKGHFKRVISENYRLKELNNGEGFTAKTYKYKFIFPKSRYDDLKSYIQKNILEGAESETINNNVAFISDDYFNILRPFPERTYIFEEGTSFNSIVCDMSEDGGVIYEIHESSNANVIKFRDSFSNMFSNKNGESPSPCVQANINMCPIQEGVKKSEESSSL